MKLSYLKNRNTNQYHESLSYHKRSINFQHKIFRFYGIAKRGRSFQDSLHLEKEIYR